MSSRVLSSLTRVARQVLDTPLALDRTLLEAGCFAMTRLPSFLWARAARGKQTGPPIIYAHGYGQTCMGFWALAHVLSSQGRGPMFTYEYSSLDDIRQSADGLGQFIEAVRYATAADAVDLIAHSMGSLVVVEHVRRAGPEHRVRRCITLASPHGGTRWLGPIPGRAATQLRRGSAYLKELAASRLPIPVLSVSSEHDDIVYPTTAWAAQGGRNTSISGVGHVALLFSEEMFQTVASFLDEPEAPRQAKLPPNLAYRRAEDEAGSPHASRRTART